MAKPEMNANRQKQAEHFKEMLASCQEIIDDPESTPEEINDAEQTARAMRDGLERLKTKYNVVPAGEEEAAAGTEPPAT